MSFYYRENNDFDRLHELLREHVPEAAKKMEKLMAEYLNEWELRENVEEKAHRGRCGAINASSNKRCGQNAYKVFGVVPVCHIHYAQMERQNGYSPGDARFYDDLPDDDLRRHPAVEEFIHRRWLASADERRIRDMSSFVYFVYRDGYIKIGSAVNVQSRMRALERGGVIIPDGTNVGPVELLGVERGGRTRESELHVKFGKFRVAGEWFRDVPSIRKYIAELPKTAELADAA